MVSNNNAVTCKQQSRTAAAQLLQYYSSQLTTWSFGIIPEHHHFC